MSKKSKIILISVIGVAVIAVIGIIIASLTSTTSGNVRVSNTELSRGNVQTMVSATGKVASADSKSIYTSAGYEILEVKVEVGDKVKAGDVLCVIDDFTVKKNIAVAEASLEKSNMSAYNALVTAERNYKDLLATSNGTTSYASSESTIKNAKLALDKAQDAYDDAKEDYENIMASDTYKDTLAAYEAADNGYRLAKKRYDEALHDIDVKYDDGTGSYVSQGEKLGTSEGLIIAYEKKLTELREKILTGQQATAPSHMNYQEMYDDSYEKLLDILPENIRALRVSLESARVSYDKALRNFNNVEENIKDAYEAAEDNLESANRAYNSALKGLDDGLEDAKAAYELALKNVQDDTNTLQLVELNRILEDCVVVAETDGTVTAVNAKEGTMASVGTPLFVVENTEKLKVQASVKEYDISDISVGQKVEVKSDVFEDEVYEGVVSLVAPAATVVQSYGASDTPYFNIEVDITSTDTKLLIGMNARINIITNEAEDVYVLRYDGIGEEEDEEGYYVLVAEPGVGETYTAKKVPVELGLESDVDAEIISSELTEGTVIIMDVDRVDEGDVVELKKNKKATEE